ncbi:PopZ family protein [uncultured Devosia sp.]|uniref:PopZ family protein n=1 Tax=uncultured Devosia sp. TaxID=211434 RepID=UPI0035C9C8EC
MNKPAPKEPSMDEILSSIRQIIADDDAAGAPRRPAIQAAPPPMQAAPARPALAASVDRDLSDMLEDIEPLALSSSQIVADEDDGDPTAGFSFDSILADTEADEDEPIAFAPPELVEAEDIAFDIAEPEPEPEPEPVFTPPPAAVFRHQPSVAQAAPMPDPTLSADIAEQLLEPATKAAVRSSITKLNGLGMGNGGATIESLMRDMLRPMLKEWLDENLPSVVERMVEKEITRIARGD